MHTSHLTSKSCAAALALIAAVFAQRAVAQNAYVQRNLVSDIAGLAEQTDPLLVNPWGLAASTSSPWWVANNGTGKSSLYDSNGIIQSLFVTVASGGTNAPTGVVFNGTTNFEAVAGSPARFIFATESGTISGWAGGNATNTVMKVDNSASNSIYKGLTIASAGGSNRLYAADFHNGKVDVFDGSFNRVSLPAGAFADATLPAGFAPFNVRSINGQIYVTYALQDVAAEDDVPGQGIGYINVFDTNGGFIKRFTSQGTLNSPWGMALAPAGFGTFGGALLVGNFGDGRINAFNLATGTLMGQLQDAKTNTISISGLWDIQFGNGQRAGSTNTLYFTAGFSAGDGLEAHGLFGSLSVMSAIQLTSVGVEGQAVKLAWAGGAGPYLLQKKASFADANWFNILTTPIPDAIVPAETDAAFYRVQDQATNQIVPFTVLMNATSEVPTNTSAGTGIGLLSLEGSNLTYSITFSGLTGNAQAGHIHAPASPTNSIGVIVPFSVPAAPAGVIAGSVVLTPSQITNIVTGKAYVNIHTVSNSAGEIRGQIVPLRVRLDMDGASEVPVVNTAGQASGTLTFLGSQLLYSINYARLTSSGTIAHIHGPADLTNSAGVLIPIQNPTGTSGTLSGSLSLTPAQLETILSGHTYVNIHTLTNGGGEIRGQILPYQYKVILDSAAEGPAVVSGGYGHGLLNLSGNSITYQIPYAGLNSAATAAHIHGPADAAHTANVLVPLLGASGASGILSGNATLTSDQLSYLAAGLTYVNIHTTNYPGGEIRGQIRPRF